MGTVAPLNLANLSLEDSFALFVKCAFDQGQEKNHPDLMVIGKEIVSKLVNFDLIQLWISNGLIQSSGNNRELEEIGWQYLEEQLSRSFFDAVQEYYPFLIFGMHDLIHELAISVAQTESSNMKVFAQDICPMTRHISFPDPSRVPKDVLRSCLGKLSRIHTVMFEEGSYGEFFLEMCISRFKHLRGMDLYGSSFDILPSSIGGLNHLRFLHLSAAIISRNSLKSFCKLRNLQCLGLGGCRGLEELPADIKNMISLRVSFITTRQQRFLEGNRMLDLSG
ncbi:hypothetical protein NL676_016738 [Syzygium grande]|nr:hypothetical protein NL676_016738 [Syzygium grande]